MDVCGPSAALVACDGCCCGCCCCCCGGGCCECCCILKFFRISILATIGPTSREHYFVQLSHLFLLGNTPAPNRCGTVAILLLQRFSMGLLPWSAAHRRRQVFATLSRMVSSFRWRSSSFRQENRTPPFPFGVSPLSRCENTMKKQFNIPSSFTSFSSLYLSLSLAISSNALDP